MTAGKNRDGIRDYDAVREERRRCHDLRIYRRRGQHWLSSGCVVHGLMQQILSFSDHGVRQSDGLVCFFAVMLEFQQCAPKKNDMQKSTDSLPGRFRFTRRYSVDSKDVRKDVPESQILGCMRSCSVRRIQSRSCVPRQMKSSRPVPLLWRIERTPSFPAGLTATLFF